MCDSVFLDFNIHETYNDECPCDRSTRRVVCLESKAFGRYTRDFLSALPDGSSLMGCSYDDCFQAWAKQSCIH